MKIGIISDIHGNYEALSVVTNYLERFCDQIFCLGDIVGYGPDPEKCVTLIRENGYKTIAGNHEYAVIDRIDYNYFHKMAKESIKYSKDQLSKKNLNYLKSLPLSIMFNGVSFCHASFYKTSSWIYLNDVNIKDQFECLQTPVGFLGHTHLPLYYRKDVDDYFVNREEFGSDILKINDESKYIINVGSLGQPRDEQTKATFGIYDFASKEFKLERMDYNIDRTLKKIRYTTLPAELATRLSMGK